MKPKKPKETNVEWKEQLIPIADPKPHTHYFEFVENGECKCRHCGFGLLGVVNIVDGKPI
jgi:hypothetical protein